MNSVRSTQSRLQGLRGKEIATLGKLSADDISSAAVVEFQTECGHIGDEEAENITTVYNQLGVMRATLKVLAEARVEELRKELHVYGSLHDEPHFHDIADIMREALEDEELAEIWRLGGG